MLEPFTQTFKLPEGQAREAVREFKTAEADMDAGYRETIDKKFEEQKDRFATKNDIYTVREDLTKLEQRLDQKIGALEVRMEQNTNKIVFWLVGTILGATGVIVALIKLL